MGQFAYRNEPFRQKYGDYQDRMRARENDPDRKRAEATERAARLFAMIAPAAGMAVGAGLGAFGGPGGMATGASVGGGVGQMAGGLAQGYGDYTMDRYRRQDEERAGKEQALLGLLGAAGRMA